MRSQKKRSLLSVNEHFEGEYKVAFKREQRVLAHFAEHSNQKELNAKITLLDSFFDILVIHTPYNDSTYSAKSLSSDSVTSP